MFFLCFGGVFQAFRETTVGVCAFVSGQSIIVTACHFGICIDVYGLMVEQFNMVRFDECSSAPRLWCRDQNAKCQSDDSTKPNLNT